MDAETDESSTTLRASISSWDLPSRNKPTGDASSSRPTHSPRDDVHPSARPLAPRVKALETAIVELNARLFALEHPPASNANPMKRSEDEPEIFTALIRDINAAKPQRENSEDWFHAARESKSTGVGDIRAKLPQRQDSEDFFEAARRSPSSTRRTAHPCATRRTTNSVVAPAEEVGIFTSLINDIKARALHSEDNEVIFDPARPSPGTRRRPGT